MLTSCLQQSQSAESRTKILCIVEIKRHWPKIYGIVGRIERRTRELTHAEKSITDEVIAPTGDFHLHS